MQSMYAFLFLNYIVLYVLLHMSYKLIIFFYIIITNYKKSIRYFIFN